jgi:hypothetical protein
MARLKKGKITYSHKTPPNTLTYKQVDIANKVANEIIKLGYDAQIAFDLCTIDIIVVMDSDVKMRGLNKGIFRVFWSSKGDNKLNYLGVGIGHYDGYEIKRGWSPNLEIKQVTSILKKDIEYYHSRKASKKIYI